jgi:CRISPR-associated protein Cas6
MTTLETINSKSFVDAAFPLRGQAIPIDHGYPLFSALSRRLPALHEKREWAVHPVRGHYQGKGVLALTRDSHVRLRLPTDDIQRILPLGGCSLSLAEYAVTLGFPRITPLRTTSHLQSRLVAIKGFGQSADDFVGALSRQLDALGPALGQESTSVEIQVGPRRVLHIKGTTIAGHAVALAGLHAQASLLLQCRGLGGRRHMGAGVFIPPRRKVVRQALESGRLKTLEGVATGQTSKPVKET